MSPSLALALRTLNPFTCSLPLRRRFCPLKDLAAHRRGAAKSAVGATVRESSPSLLCGASPAVSSIRLLASCELVTRNAWQFVPLGLVLYYIAPVDPLETWPQRLSILTDFRQLVPELLDLRMSQNEVS